MAEKRPNVMQAAARPDGRPWLGGVIVTATIGTLAVTFVRRSKSGK